MEIHITVPIHYPIASSQTPNIISVSCIWKLPDLYHTYNREYLFLLCSTALGVANGNILDVKISKFGIMKYNEI
jgi:hypothetical protein